MRTLVLAVGIILFLDTALSAIRRADCALGFAEACKKIAQDYAGKDTHE